MPKDATAARAAMADRNLNLAPTVAGTVTAGGQIQTYYLRFAGLQAKPEDVFDALVTKFGSGKVTMDNDASGHGVFSLVIVP